MASRALRGGIRARFALAPSAWNAPGCAAQCAWRQSVRALAATTSTAGPAPGGATDAGGCFRAAYARLLNGGLHADGAQRAAAGVLARVGDDVGAAVRAAHALGPFARALRSVGLQRAEPVRGAYLCGGVGSGKTLLAELLYECVPAGARKRQHHFHAFVLDVHARLHAKRGARAADKIGEVATDIASETGFLLLDEFQVTDISDAVVVHHLFRRLFELGVVLVATSNRVPERLYENGLQRDLFLPVVPLIRHHCEVHVMGHTRDYRLRNARADRRVWFRDANGGAAALQEMFDALAEGFPAREARIDVLGRKLVVPMAVADKALAFFTFEELCNRPLAAADYIALCNTYHTICVANVPVIDVVSDRNASRRLTKFVDEAYRVGTKVVVNASTSIDNLFVRPPEHAAQTEEAFESHRIQSRLFEMQSDEYLEREWLPEDVDYLDQLQQEALQDSENEGSIDFVEKKL